MQRMGRTPVSGVVRDERVTVRFTPQEAARLDARRGTASRSTYIRYLVNRSEEHDE